MTAFLDAYLFVDTIRFIEERYVVQDIFIRCSVVAGGELSSESVSDSLSEIVGN